MINQEPEHRTRSTPSLQHSNSLNVVVFGRGNAGKTSLVSAISEQKFNPHSSETQGLDMSTLDGKILNIPDAKINLHDFAGQEVTHGLHKLFVKPESIFIVVVSGRYAVQDAEHWIGVIDSNLSPENSRQVIIAHTKADCSAEDQVVLSPFSFASEFRNFKIKIVSTDSETGRGIEDLKSIIHEFSNNVVRPIVPSEFIAIEAELNQELKKWMIGSELITLLKKHNVTAEADQKLCLQYLAEVNCITPISLEELCSNEVAYVSNPLWFSKSVYGLLRFAQSQGGELDKIGAMQDMGYINHADYLIIAQALVKNEIAFLKPDTKNSYIVPICILRSAPYETLAAFVNSQKQQDETASLISSPNIEIRLTFQGEIERGLAIAERMFCRHSTMILPDQIWRNAAILERDGAKGLLLCEHYKSTLRLYINGQEEGSTAKLARFYIEELTEIISPHGKICRFDLKVPNGWIDIKSALIDQENGRLHTSVQVPNGDDEGSVTIELANVLQTIGYL